MAAGNLTPPVGDVPPPQVSNVPPPPVGNVPPDYEFGGTRASIYGMFILITYLGIFISLAAGAYVYYETREARYIVMLLISLIPTMVFLKIYQDLRYLLIAEDYFKIDINRLYEHQQGSSNA
jgi:hypothetical protein